MPVLPSVCQMLEQSSYRKRMISRVTSTSGAVAVHVSGTARAVSLVNSVVLALALAQLHTACLGAAL